MIKSFGECFSEFGFSNAAWSGKEERGKRFPWPSEAKVGATKRVDNTGNCVVLPDNLLAQLFFGFIQMLPFVACDKIRINSQSSAKRFDNVSFCNFWPRARSGFFKLFLQYLQFFLKPVAFIF